MRLLTQPAQSPDMNARDLSCFNALQSAQWDHGFAKTVDGLIAQVIRACDEFPMRKMDFGFITLQFCLDEILSSNGDNTCKVPHTWGRRDFFETAFFLLVFVQVLKPSRLQGRWHWVLTRRTLMVMVKATTLMVMVKAKATTLTLKVLERLQLKHLAVRTHVRRTIDGILGASFFTMSNAH
jgi:hypothetical protein